MENKTGKYFKYAIGEIILVVIGILIALQINNWNESNKKNESWKTYTGSLINDLQQDTITLNTITKFIDTDSIYQENLIKRLSSKQATRDTLIKIARYDLIVNGKAYRPPNDKTFLAMQANGTVELFDKQTYALLLELQNQQAIAGSIIKINVDTFITHVEDLNSKYSTDVFNPLSGPLLEKAWENIDEDDLFRTVQGFLTAKKMANRNTSKQYYKLLQITEKVLDRLIKVTQAIE